jgi:group I intron endonuclease
MRGYIYIIKNKSNNKVYVGQTRTSVEQRFKEHLRHAKTQQYPINRAIYKYGFDNFDIRVTCECDLDILDQMEQLFISMYNSTKKEFGYNVSIGGKTPQFEKANIDERKVIEMYKSNHYSLAQIGEVFNVSRYIITTILKNNNITLSHKSEHTAFYNKITRDELISLLQTHKSLRKAAKSINVDYCTFRTACKKHRI